jgi:RNA polymerase sigma factor (sigma-70 family)
LEDDIQKLINGCKLNDRKAQEQLYRRFYGAMASICLPYTKNQEDTKEVLNNGFLKVFKNIGQFDPAKASFYTWARKIIINVSIDFLRSQHVGYTTMPLENLPEPGIDNTIVQQIDAEELLLLIRQLPPATRLVFNLYSIEGYNHREIAHMLTISEGTSKWHLSEARKVLKSLIQIQRSEI